MTINIIKYHEIAIKLVTVERMKEKNAVSSVIGVILMVAITVLLAAVLYVWAGAFMGEGNPMTPIGALTPPTEPEGPGEANSTTCRVVTISTKVDSGKIKWYVYNCKGIKKDCGTLSIGTWSSDNGSIYVQIEDNDNDTKLSTNDLIKIYQTTDGTIVSGDMLSLMYIDTGEEITRTTFK